MTPVAGSFPSGAPLAGLLAAHPHVQLDIVLGDGPRDIVAEGYDAGGRLGEVIDEDMIAVPVSGDLRSVVVGAPSYFATADLSVRALAPSAIATRSYRHSSHDTCPWNVRFSTELPNDSPHRPRAVAGKDAGSRAHP